MLSVDTIVKAQFYDLDPMDVVWHGNYARFLEQARCDLLDRLQCNYRQMKEEGYVFPIVHLNVKYVRPIRMAQEVVVTSTLAEYENRLKIDYRLKDKDSGLVLTKAQTVQVAVKIDTGELCLECPSVFVERIRRHLS
ncbi:thioesterase family protein [Reyranella sp. CPCC 100927]|uniref:acyl-CoA thioesterase n=1 Tax=Reyranella sp. CPCC 100927 TaxID=2599616 RepID=UPI0011B5D1AB|nr:thioesterase family protein [Reyranella sp. CPCC 100927]TWT13694.1 acyl-CoA thioesterase [Reyranella sp. CPCC 100927]